MVKRGCSEGGVDYQRGEVLSDEAWQISNPQLPAALRRQRHREPIRRDAVFAVGDLENDFGRTDEGHS